jgi:hypothetical protein
MPTLNARTVTYLQRLGYLATVVEGWIPHLNKRRDLFTIGDVLAIHPRDKSVLMVQVTSLDHVGDRLKRCRHRPELALWLKAGCRFEVHGWERRDGRWVVKIVDVQADDLEAVTIVAPPSRRRRKGERQRELFV